MELQTIQNKIYEIRGKRVMLDRDLAELYGVETKALNKAVKRNSERFPERFMFQLTKEESLRFQIGTLNEHSGKQARGQHLKYLPHVFTEQGVSMLSAVLRSPTAIQVSIRIMDAFVAMRNYIMTTSTITAELSEIRAKLTLLERADAHLFIRHGLLGSIPARESYDYLISFISYFTIAFTASSPSIATATIPAGTAIVALSEVRTVSATTLPKMLVITTDLPAAP